MCEPRFGEKVLRPTVCPFCGGLRFDPVVAGGVTAQTFWRCRECNQTWTLACVPAFSMRVH